MLANTFCLPGKDRRAGSKDDLELLRVQFLFLMRVLSKKTIPQREEQKEKEKQEKRKELDLFVSDAQKQLENLKKQKERIRKNIIQKAHENESKPKVSRKTQSICHVKDRIVIKRLSV